VSQRHPGAPAERAEPPLRLDTGESYILMVILGPPLNGIAPRISENVSHPEPIAKLGKPSTTISHAGFAPIGAAGRPPLVGAANDAVRKPRLRAASEMKLWQANHARSRAEPLPAIGSALIGFVARL